MGQLFGTNEKPPTVYKKCNFFDMHVHPLYKAITKNNIEELKLLLREGHNPKCFWPDSEETLKKILYETQYWPHLNLRSYLDSDSMFETPATLAIRKKNINALNILINAGVNILSINDRGESALTYVYIHSKSGGYETSGKKSGFTVYLDALESHIPSMNPNEITDYLSMVIACKALYNPMWIIDLIENATNGNHIEFLVNHSI